MGNTTGAKITEAANKLFSEVYEQEADAVFRFCLLRTSDREVALDFTQDTFMRFWGSLSGGKDIKNCRTFLFTIARNIIIDWYRKKKAVSLESLLEGAGGDGKMGLLLSTNDDVEVEAEAEYVIRKIALLEEPYRSAVYLRCVEELKPREIAGILGESSNVISVRISRGLNQLRGLLNFNHGKT